MSTIKRIIDNDMTFSPVFGGTSMQQHPCHAPLPATACSSTLTGDFP